MKMFLFKVGLGVSILFLFLSFLSGAPTRWRQRPSPVKLPGQRKRPPRPAHLLQPPCDPDCYCYADTNPHRRDQHSEYYPHAGFGHFDRGQFQPAQQRGYLC